MALGLHGSKLHPQLPQLCHLVVNAPEVVPENLPDGVAASALAAAVGASGAVVGLETHQIFDHDEQAAIVKHAGTALRVYKPPTA